MSDRVTTEMTPDEMMAVMLEGPAAIGAVAVTIEMGGPVMRGTKTVLYGIDLATGTDTIVVVGVTNGRATRIADDGMKSRSATPASKASSVAAAPTTPRTPS